MKQITLLALFALLQAPSPIPRNAANNSSQKSQNSQDKTATEQARTGKAKSITNPADSVANQQTATNQTNTNEYKAEPVRVAPVDIQKDWTDYLYILANLLLTLITLGIAIFAAIQARAAKRSADNDEKSVRLTERADILMEAAGMNSPSGQFDGHTMVKLMFKNFGRTRANNVVLNVDLLRPGVSPVPTDMPQIAMAAGDSQTVTFGNFMSCMTQETFIAISRGKQKLEFVGKVTYEDVFGDSHICECGGYFEYRTGSFVCTKNEGK